MCAFFRNSQTSDARMNTLYDLPNAIWMGPILYDKNTFEPIAGYDMPNIPYGLNNSLNRGLPSFLNAGSISHNYIALSHNFGLGQYAHMASNLYPLQHIPETNIIDDMPKPYYVDPDNVNMIYFVHVSSNFISDISLVKFDISKQKVIWAKFLSPGYREQVESASYDMGRPKYKILKIKDGIIYLISENITRSYPSPSYVTYSNYAKMISKVDARTGKFTTKSVWTKLRNVTNPIVLEDISGIPSIGCGNSLVKVTDVNENETLFFTMVFESVKDIPYLQSTEGNVNYYLAPKMRAGFCKYNYANHTFIVPEDIQVLTYPDFYLLSSLEINYYYQLHMPKSSQVDKTIKDKYTLYACWDKLANVNIADSTDITVRRINKFEYDPSTETQKATPLTVYNKDGNIFTKSDWKTLDVSNYISYSQPYIIYGENKKYLMIYDNKLSTAPLTTDNIQYTHLFEFIDNNTLKLVDQIPLAIQDIIWLKDNVFVGLRKDKIRFYKINTESGKFEIIKQLLPATIKNIFIYACVDDLNNFWYAEAISNTTTAAYFNNFNLNYLNDYTINKIDIIKEQDSYVYEDEPIETYLTIKVVNDYGLTIDRFVEITIEGPAIFKETENKKLKIKTNVNDITKVEYIITGEGEITFNSSFVKI